jgi:AcrR family transcriptional regulator
MARSGSGRRQLGTSAEDARDLLLRAAERCVERHGFHKTTIDDVAREAGVSRPSVYRYFEDRDDLLLAVMAERSGALIQRAHKFIRRQPSFEDQLVEGLLYIADHGRRDPFMRRLVAGDDSRDGQRLLQAHNAAARFASEFWDPILDEAEAQSAFSTTVDRNDVHLWLAHLGLILMSLLDGRPETTERFRAILHGLVVPGFCPTNGRNSSRKARALTKQS